MKLERLYIKHVWKKGEPNGESVLTKTLNTLLERGYFPDQLKSAEVTPVFKKKDELNKINCCPVSAPSHLSKIFKIIAFNQMNLFLESRFAPLLTGLLENHSTQNALVNMIENRNTRLIKAKRLVLYLWMYLKRSIN